MKTLILGASGATGKHLVDQLINNNNSVRIIVRSTSNIPEFWLNHKNLEIITAEISETSLNTMTDLLSDCDSVACCLGHTPSFKGIYGKPRRLVTNAVKLVCDSIKEKSPAQPMKFVLMNTTANANRDLNEPNPLKNRVVIGLLRLLVPPHPDNEQAADYLRVDIGQNNSYISWVAVRPDGLIDDDVVTSHEAHKSPIRNPIFDAGKISRINVANFMYQLLIDDVLYKKWQGQMPVIYNKSVER